jgi:radical SAM superfamily enzyme YgiQ (UPF0313 family)
MSKLLIIAPSSRGIYQNLAEDFSAREPNLWAGLLANAVRAKSFPVSIYDMEIEHPNRKDFISHIESVNPDLILFVAMGANPNASSSAMQGAVDAAQIVFEDYGKAKIAFVGTHVNALPRETLIRHTCIDIAFTNEGVYSLISLLNTDMSDEALKSVKGICWKNKKGGEITLNDAGPIVPQDMLGEDLPGVAYDLMPPLSKYRTSDWHTGFQGDTSPFASIYTSLGCFAKCSFCCINQINRTDNDPNHTAANFNVFRYWKPEFTITQLEYLAEQGVKHLKIADEMFVYRPKHFMKLCELIIERGLDFNIWAYSRVDTAKPQYLETLRKAGVRHVALGIESSNQNVRQEIDKGRFNDINIRDIVKRIDDHDIGVGGNFILGLPTDTYSTMQETMNLAFELPLANMNVYCATALPGSPLFLQAQKEGRELPQQYSEFGFLSYDHVPDSTEFLTSRQVLEFRDYFFNSYFTNPGVLDMMNKRFGGDAVQNIQKMTSIKLRRKLLGH